MSKIKLEAGMQVKCIVNGLGIIKRIKNIENYPIGVNFETRGDISFTEQGREVKSDANPTLKLLNIPFTEGLEVECDIYGSGFVKEISELNGVFVEFNNGKHQHYRTDGRINILANQTLFPQFTI